MCDKDAISKLSRHFEEHPDIKLIVFNHVSVTRERDASIFSPEPVKTSLVESFDINWYLNDVFKPQRKQGVCSYVYKREVLQNDDALWETIKLPFEDEYFTACVLNQKNKALTTNEVFYAYRMNNVGSIMWNAAKLGQVEK